MSPEKCTIMVLSGSTNPARAMTCAAPKRDAPAALQLPKKFRPVSQDPGTDASRPFTIFHGLGENHCRSCPFQQNRFILEFSCNLREWQSKNPEKMYLITLFLVIPHVVPPTFFLQKRISLEIPG
jgi:hypothetical protein